jgi:type II secretory pathway component PulF
MVMATLLRSGVPFVQAARIARDGTTNTVLRDTLERCEQAVLAGRDLDEALSVTGVLPPMVVQVFGVGQQSGRLEDMLDRLTIDYDQQVQAATHRLTTLLEPLIIVLLAVVVGFIAFATVLPILEAGDVL